VADDDTAASLTVWKRKATAPVVVALNTLVIRGAEPAPGMRPNQLILRIQPEEGISLRFLSKDPGEGMHLRPVSMDFNYGTSFGSRSPSAYETLLVDAKAPAGHLPALIRGIKPAVIVAGRTKSGNLLDNAIAENVRRQVTRLKTSPPIVQKLYRDKKIDIVGGMYDLATGKVALV